MQIITYFQTYSTSSCNHKLFRFSFAPVATCSGHSEMIWLNARRQRNPEINEVFVILGNWVSFILFTSNKNVEISWLFDYGQASHKPLIMNSTAGFFSINSNAMLFLKKMEAKVSKPYPQKQSSEGSLKKVVLQKF